MKNITIGILVMMCLLPLMTPMFADNPVNSGDGEIDDISAAIGEIIDDISDFLKRLYIELGGQIIVLPVDPPIYIPFAPPE